MADYNLQAAKNAARTARNALGNVRTGDNANALKGVTKAVDELHKAVNAIIAHLEAHSGIGPDDALPPITGEGGPGGAPEENDLDASGEPRQFD